MNMVKVYDADGKYVDSFKKSDDPKVFAIHDKRIRHLNTNGFYVRGQTTSKGVKIK